MCLAGFYQTAGGGVTGKDTTRDLGRRGPRAGTTASPRHEPGLPPCLSLAGGSPVSGRPCHAPASSLAPARLSGSRATCPTLHSEQEGDASTRPVCCRPNTWAHVSKASADSPWRPSSAAYLHPHTRFCSFLSFPLLVCLHLPGPPGPQGAGGGRQRWCGLKAPCGPGQVPHFFVS